MAKQKKSLPPKFQQWVDARKRTQLSHAHIQMARELGMNPKKFTGKANQKQQPGRLPLPVFIESLYFKRFGKERPDNVRSIEQIVRDRKQKQAERKARKIQEEELQQSDSSVDQAETEHSQSDTDLQDNEQLTFAPPDAGKDMQP